MKENIKQAIQKFANHKVTENALCFFETLGYNTKLQITQNQKTGVAFDENFIANSAKKDQFNKTKALFDQWKSIDLLFQLNTDLAGVSGGKFNNQIIESVVFMTIELQNSNYSRTQLADVTRQINNLFAMPIVILFQYNSCITLSIIHRRINKKDGQKDVLEKVSFIKDISIDNPHRAQLEILNDFAFDNLLSKKKPTNFVELTLAWEMVFSTKELNKKFFKKIANWYFWSVATSKFPYEYLKSDAKNKDKTNFELQNIANQKATIRFITRMIFVWFLKEKKLIPENLFDKDYIDTILKKSNNNANYYNAILQNLFFATLNRKNDLRDFALDKGFNKNKSTYDMNSFFRYENLYLDENPLTIMQRFETIPFINGGLFDCLDVKDNDHEKQIIDGFSRNEKWQATMPDELFFENNNVDFNAALNEVYQTKTVKYEVKGLFEIFNEYKFTVEENTPLEVDVALDPYLLGEIFENLLAYYNPETGATARKGSGSFYTPQEIVNYMVNESLLAYLQPFSPNLTNFENLHNFKTDQKHQLVKALSEVKILDPACGSGAFPMGVLYKMVDILKTIDPENSIWKAVQHDKIIGDKIKDLENDKKAIENLSDKEVRTKATKAVEDRLLDLENNFNNEHHFDDYTRKLYIIRNSIYGVDIQDVAIQISKLRFFLSLIIDQKNENINPLPNLETKFVIANTLIGIELPKFTVMGEEDYSQDQVKHLKEELKAIRDKHFYVTDRKEKQTLKKQDAAKRQEIANALADSMTSYKQEDIDKWNTEITHQKTLIAEAEQMPDMVQEIIVKDLFGGETTTKVNYRKERIKEALAQIRITQTKIDSLTTNTQAEQIRTQALKIADWDIYNQNAQAEWFDSDWMFGISDGFDIVIGNPPYVQLQKDGGKLANMYQNKGFETFERTGDIYALFYENGINLLKNGGTLNFITSNKWMRAGYGKSLRNFFCKNNPLKLIDLGADVFETATVDANILLIQKNTNQNQTLALDLSKEKNISDLNVFNNRWLDFNNLTSDNWTLLNQLEDKIKSKAEKFGTPLKNWEININRGITSGFNEAYIIDNEQRNGFIKLNKKNKSILKPLLRGKDIKRYSHNESKLWLIFIPWHFPLHNDSSISGNSKVAEKEFQKEYPEIYDHLLGFKKELSSRNKSETGIRYEWYALQRCANTYFNDFEKEKIIYSEISIEPSFCLDNDNFFVGNTAYILTGKNLKYLNALLNSKFITYIFSNFYSVNLGAKGYRYLAQYMENLPIKQIPLSAQQPFINLVDKILEGKKSGANTSDLEHQIDVMVYHLYELNYEEAKIIDKDLKEIDFYNVAT